MRALFATIAIAAALAGCRAPASTSASHTAGMAAMASASRAVHEAYVNAINSNDLDTLMGMLTDDVVYLPPHEPAIVGKEAVEDWVEGYFSAFQTKWVKTTDEFWSIGDWAFERYSYESTDTPRAGGPPVSDKGKGLNIYHHDSDGTWRVARDAWNSDLAIPAK